MSLSVPQMRDYISKFYEGAGWRKKVANMSENQVIAIYHSFKEHGKQPLKPKKREKYHQITMEEYLLAKEGGINV